MSNKGANQSNAMIGTQIGANTARNDALYNTFNTGLQGAQGRSDRAFNAAFGGYNDIAMHGLGNGGRAPVAGTLGGGTGLLANVPRLGSGQWSDFIKTGGMTPEEKEAAMGWGLFKNWATSPTGGLTDQQVQDIYGEGVAPISGFYGSLRNNLERLNASQGGYNPGFTAQMGEMTRQQGAEGARAARETRLGLTEQIGERQKFGAETGSQRQLQMSELVNKYKAMGMNARDAINRANAQMQMSANQSAASMGMASAQANTAARLQGLGGLYNLRGQTPGEVNMYINALLGHNEQAGQQNNPLLNLRVQNNPRRDYLGGAMNMIGNVATGALTGGLSSLFSRPKAPSSSYGNMTVGNTPHP